MQRDGAVASVWTAIVVAFFVGPIGVVVTVVRLVRRRPAWPFAVGTFMACGAVGVSGWSPTSSPSARRGRSGVTVLAIDQGTSGTKAIVVDPDDGVIGLAEVAVHPRYLTAAGSSRTRANCCDSVLDAGRAALAQAGRPDRRGGAGQPGRDGAGLGPGHRPAAVAGHRLAGPPRRSRLRARLADARRAVRRAHRPGARPLLLRAQDGLAAPQRRRPAAW